MATVPNNGLTLSVGAVLGRVQDLPDAAATPAKYAAEGREIAVLVVRRGAKLRAYLALCPHQYLPLAWRGPRVLSGDGEHLRCANHGVEFAVADGRGLSGLDGACTHTPVPLRVDPDGTVRVGEKPGSTAALRRQ